MHFLTLLLLRIMGEYQILCGDIEMTKRRLGQERNTLKLGNIFFYHTLPKIDPRKSLN